MKRGIYFGFFNFEHHIDLSFISNKDVTYELLKIGDLLSNNRTIAKFNNAYIYYNGELSDDYDEIIISLIDAVGGDDVVSNLVQTYNAKISYIMLSIPCKTSEWVEDGYISSHILKRLCELNIDIQFQYT